jgi:hypothetical protein
VSFITEVCHKSDYHGNLPPSLWPLKWGTGKELGPADLQQYWCGQTLKLAELQKAINSFFPCPWCEESRRKVNMSPVQMLMIW